MMYSVFLFLECIEEEEEGGASIGLFFVVAVSEWGIHVVGLTNEDLDLVELAQDELYEFSCTLLEGGDSVGLAFFFKLALDLLYVFYKDIKLDILH